MLPILTCLVPAVRNLEAPQVPVPCFVIVVAVANTVADTESLYGQGVDYVIMPHLLGAQYAAKTVQDLQFDRKKFASLRQRHIKYLASRGYKQ